jgi:hypothetical protein
MTDQDLNRRTAVRRRRWRTLSRVASGSLGAAAVAGALYLGVTAPPVSPVQPAAAAAPAEAAPAATDVDRDPIRPDTDRRGDPRSTADLGHHR